MPGYGNVSRRAIQLSDRLGVVSESDNRGDKFSPQ